jgi:hypothetical protein
MDNKQKLGIAGAGMLACGIGLTVAGLVCVTPFVVSLAVRAVQKGTEQAIQGIEQASKRQEPWPANWRWPCVARRAPSSQLDCHHTRQAGAFTMGCPTLQLNAC